MISFYMNGIKWRLIFVDPLSPLLVDRTNRLTVATTDPRTHYICMSLDLEGPFLNRVLVHELGHCAMFSFGLLKAIHRMVKPRYWVEAEEWVCNFIANYGYEIFQIADYILSNVGR